MKKPLIFITLLATFLFIGAACQKAQPPAAPTPPSPPAPLAPVPPHQPVPTSAAQPQPATEPPTTPADITDDNLDQALNELDLVDD